MRYFLFFPLWLCAVLLMGTIDFNVAMAQSATPYPYRYVYRTTKEGNYTLHMINPADPEAGEETLIIPVNKDELIHGTIISPDGRWIMAQMGTALNDDVSVRILTSDARVIGDFLPHSIMGWHSWSPDSQWIAIPAYSRDEAKSVWYGYYHMYLYHVGTKTLYALDKSNKLFSEGNKYYTYGYGTAWTEDSSHVAIVNLDCTKDCTKELKVIDVATMEEVVYKAPTNDQFCGLKWSPDERMIALLFSCEVGLSHRIDDVFIWSLDENVWLPVTRRTAPLEEDYSQSTTTYSLSHSFFWLDNETLLTSSLGGQFSEGSGFRRDDFSFQTNAYLVSSGQVKEIAPEIFADWKVNPADNQIIAFRRETYQLFPEPEYFRYYVKSAQLEIARKNGSSLTPLYTAESSCSISWSPDGRYLAHLNPIEGCVGAKESLEFWDRKTMTNIHTALNGELYGGGWIMIP